MKIRRSILWAAAVAALSITALLWFRRPSAERGSQTVTMGASQSQAQLVTPSPQHIVQESVAAASGSAKTSAPAPAASGEAEQIRKTLSALNDVPVVFYGKLQDQFGDPVAGAKIKGNTIVYNGRGSSASHVSATSDANGLFRIDAGKGESLGIMPSKEGYALATTRTEFKYSAMYPDHFSADARNPVVIRMWRLQGAEPLVGVDQSFKCHFDDHSVNFDLLSGKIVTNGGDLRITVNRPRGVVSQRNPQDWSVQVEAVDGGLIETSMAEARITYSAPASGYMPTDLLVESTTNHWSDLVQQMYFLTSRNGQVFAKIHFSVDINADANGPVFVAFRGVANPGRSRNWEARRRGNNAITAYGD